MRGWQIEGFGVFRGHEVHDLVPGLTIVEGANEAGKSTARRALIAALFGIERTTPDGHRFGVHGLRLGTRLFGAGGARLSFVRQGLAGLARDDGSPLDAATLDPFLGGVDEVAYRRLFARLDWLSERLARTRYLVGDTITEADVRLWTTLVRFDAVYHGHFKCNRNKLSEMPVLFAYARDLFQTPGFGDTVDVVDTKRHYYEVHRTLNPGGIVPAGPDLSGWSTAHGREVLGGRPFGDGTPPSPPLPDEQVPQGHGVPVAG